VPLYDYDCAACGRRFEVIHGVHADPPSSCPLCGSGPVRKAIAAPAIHFKGSGWAKKERRAGTRTGAASATDSEAAGEGASSDEAGAGAVAASGDGAAEGAGSSTGSTGSTGSSGSTKKSSTTSSTSGTSSKSSGPSD
jgi:putative FmdB family regulatory protein